MYVPPGKIPGKQALLALSLYRGLQPARGALMLRKMKRKTKGFEMQEIFNKHHIELHISKNILSSILQCPIYQINRQLTSAIINDNNSQSNGTHIDFMKQLHTDMLVARRKDNEWNFLA